MVFTKDQYFKNIGFNEDPFTSTNAGSELMLEKYFITPPHFSSLVGSFDNPKSSIVIAPRGGGKTAQRKMIEHLANNTKELRCIVYDRFPLEGFCDASEIKYEDHLKMIIKYLLVDLLSIDNEKLIDKYSDYDKKTINLLAKTFLTDIEKGKVANAIDSIKGARGRFFDLWDKVGESVNSIINAALAIKNIGGVALKLKDTRVIKISDDELFETIKYIGSLYKKIGTKAVYILVDSVDETHLSGNNSKNSYDLIRPLIKDLKTLELDTIVFKFFLWDKIQNHWGAEIRRDRIEVYEMTWNKEHIIHLIQNRIKAFSDFQHNNIEELFEYKKTNLINHLIDFSNFSPRDAINIFKFVFDRHLKYLGSNSSELPDEKTVIAGLFDFCRCKFDEIVYDEEQKKLLKQIKKSTFTLKYLQEKVFICSENKAIELLTKWIDSDWVIPSSTDVEVQEVNNYRKVYTIKDLRVARYICSDLDLNSFVESNVIECEECGTTNVFDRKNEFNVSHIRCYYCQSNLIAQ